MVSRALEFETNNNLNDQDRMYGWEHFESPPSSQREGQRSPPRGRYPRQYPAFRPQERTPSPPREYVYGVRRQLEWQDLHPDDDGYSDYNHYPEEDYDRNLDRGQSQRFGRPEDRWESQQRPQQPSRRGGRSSYYEEEEHHRRWQEEQERRRRWQEEEEDRRRWEAEERYRRWEEEELRRYQREMRDRKEAEDQQRREEEQHRREEEDRLQKEEEKRAMEHVAELMNPSSIPKPPPPPTEIEGSVLQPDHWAMSRVEKNNSGKSALSTNCKESWNPPYQFYSSEHSERKPLHMCKTSCDDAHYNMEKLAPASLKKDNSNHSGKVGAFAEKNPHGPLKKMAPAMAVEIQPGFSLPLRGSQATIQAVTDGHVLETCCMACCECVVVKDDCDFVICPECRVVSPVEGGFGTMEFVGLGMKKSIADARCGY